jgi:tetratricopeptide (TPR) repeat protein
MIRDLQRRAVLCSWILLFLFLSSCGSSKREQVQRDTDRGTGQAQREVEAGGFQRAIDICLEIYQKYPQDPAVRSGYIRTLELIKDNGDRAFEKKDFGTAGNTYEILAKNWSHYENLSLSLSFKRSFLAEKVKTSRCLFVRGQVPSLLKAGEFQRAIEMYEEIYQKYPQDPALRSGYIRTLESIKSNGDQAFEGGDFVLAGWVYQILLKDASSVNRLNGFRSFDKDDLTARIKTCKKNLFENGLKKYRSGNLDHAISIWKGILTFDPGDQEVQRLLDRATLQLENLQKIK